MPIFDQNRDHASFNNSGMKRHTQWCKLLRFLYIDQLDKNALDQLHYIIEYTAVTIAFN